MADFDHANYIEDAPEERKKKRNKEIFSWVRVVLIAAVAAFLISNFIIINAVVPSSSMENTIMKEDRFIALRLSYLFSSPQRGEIIVFEPPDKDEDLYVKRIIGLPGETVEIVSGVLYIDGVVYEENYLKEPMTGSFGPYTVPEDCYFMMGDNRNDSHDARYWTNTFLPSSMIKGKALFQYYPNIKWIS